MEFQPNELSHCKNLPRFIPEEVLQQLYFHLATFPAFLSRMLLLLVESGLRVNELCNLPFDCLTWDEAGNWSLRYHQLKIQQEHTLSISRLAAVAIREQQQAVRDEQGSTTRVLFPNAKGLPISQGSFMKTLNGIARERSIRDASGAVWQFRARQFRQTAIARKFIDGVPLHLMHRHLDMQTIDEAVRVYKHLFDPSQNELLFPHLNEITGGKGKCDEQSGLSESEGAEWIYKKVFTDTTPAGYCTLPPTVSQCPHICGHWAQASHFFDLTENDL